MDCRLRTIDFGVLDDVLLADDNRCDQIAQLLLTYQVRGIGPAAEYSFQQPRYSKVLPPLEALADSNAKVAIRSALRSNGEPEQLRGTSLVPLQLEFAALRFRDSLPKSAGWVAYLKRLDAAARSAGFTSSIAGGIVATVRELVDNLDLHSEASDSGLAGYAFSKDSFEFVIADSGIGVLASLQRSPDYAHITDHGQALFTALTDGESRFGRGTNHGHGFRQLFVSLAHLHGTLRFRSGNHRLEIEGSSPSLPTATVSQAPYFQGFMAWVACRPAPRRISA